ncbi:MAG: hypothetical protein JJE55_14880 [Flavobacteriaceae bacterium]|nr:hypothetical protein [Flavobacteriaceae bacterium]
MAQHYRETLKRNAAVVVSYMFVLLFLYAATSKLLDFETFTVQLAQSPLLSAYAGIIAWLIPGIEIAIAILLMVPKFRTLALYAAFTLMVMFTAYIYIILNLSDFIPCSCGGVLEKLSWRQHLIFNVVFIVLAAVAIALTDSWGQKKKTISLISLGLGGIAVISVLFVFSEKKMQQNNAFQRRFVPHPIEEIAAINLGYNSYYLAGITDSVIYLGNVTAPLNILKLDKHLVILDSLRIQLEDMDVQYQNIQVDVQPPHFFVSDGNVPIVLQGNTHQWFGRTLMKDYAYFSQFIPVDTTQFVMRTIDGQSHQNIIASYGYKDSVLKKNGNLLESQMDGVFDTDGQLLYNLDHKKFIYIYYYRNQYFAFDRDLVLEKRLRTIDTVTRARLEIHHISSTGQNKLSPNALRINKTSSTDGSFLFVQSDRLGKYEDADNLKRAATIDVYDFEKEIYVFSFYIYDYKQSKLTSFNVRNNLLYAVMGDYLVLYRLNPTYFKDKHI